MKTKVLASAICGLGMLVSGSASATVIGGVDFGPFFDHLDTTTVAETFVNAPGQTLQGYGAINTINGNLAYAGTDKLFFIFDYLVDTFSPAAATFTGGTVRIYKRSNFNLLLQASDGVGGNLDLIDDGALWLTLVGHPNQGTTTTLAATGILTGASLSFTGSGLLDVDMTPGTGFADAQAALNANTIADGFLPGFGFADVLLTSSASNRVLNSHDDTSRCRILSGPSVGDWCLAGSADLRGDLVIPEPSVLALLGLGLVGLGSSRRKRQTT